MDDEPGLLGPLELRFLWRMLWLAAPMYGIAGVLLRFWWGTPPDAPPLSFALPLWGIAGMATVGILFARRLGLNRAPLYLTQWGLSELIALVGTVLFLLGESPIAFLLFLAWSLGLHVGTAPPADEDDFSEVS